VGISGSESLRGPPHAEQDMEVGVFCRVHLKHSQTRLWITPSSGLRGPEQLAERRGRPGAPHSEQAGRSAGLDSVQRGQDRRPASPPEPCHVHRASGLRRRASQMEQLGAPAALRKVQQPQAHWLLGIEPEEKLNSTCGTSTQTMRFSGCIEVYA